jgi:hypothetical protein
MQIGRGPFVGSEAIASGLLRKHELRGRYRTVFPDVYVAKDAVLTIHERAIAAWLWSHRHGVVAGLTAAALHGSKWIDDCHPIELIWQNARRPRGLRTYDMRLGTNEYEHVGGVLATTPERTAFDIGRRGRLDEVVARLDALGHANAFKIGDVLHIAQDHPGARGIRQLRRALDLSDHGAASPKETWLRLVVIRGGYPRPQTQIRIPDSSGYARYCLDMGWDDILIAMEYDGDQHRTDRPQFVKDIRRLEYLREVGWIIIRVVAEDRPVDILHRLRRAWDSRTR